MPATGPCAPSRCDFRYNRGVDATFFLYLGITLVIAITFHEFGHAAAATSLGDDTAQMQGRLTLNPLKHLDPIGSLMFVLVHFGWGKPVPVNLNNLKNPLRDHALVALAGPMMNFVLALAAAFAVQQNGARMLGATEFLMLFLHVNLLLMLFNLLPFPPLDGGAVLGLFIRNHETLNTLQQYGPMVFLGLLGVNYIFHVPVFSYLLNTPVNAMTRLLLTVTGGFA